MSAMMSLDLKNKGPKACNTCAKAKSRCIPGPEGSDKCERCYRLSKSCTSQTPAPPRPKKEPKPTKVAELEKRLNELTSQLHSAQSSSLVVAAAAAAAGPVASASGSAQGSGPSSPSPVKPTKTFASTPARTIVVPIGRPQIEKAGGKGYAYRLDHLFPPATTRDDDDDACSHGGYDDDYSGYSPRTTTTDPASEEGSPESHNSSPAAAASASVFHPAPEPPLVTDVPWPSGPEADGLLRRFREELEPIYPFVITPPDLDATTLALRSPYLFKGVMVSAYYDDAYRQLRLGDRLLQEITRAGFTQPHRSLDVVQALQLLIAWFQYNVNSYQLTNLLFLARSMCFTLGFNEAACGPGAGGGVDGIVHSLDHLRAFVGCYYETTVVFTTSKRADAFMNTTYVEKCCAVLAERAEYPTDRLVVSLFKIMQLAQSICVTLGTDNSLYPSMQVPITAVVQSFQQQLEMFKAALPDDLKRNEPIAAHVRVAEVLLYESAIPDVRASRVPISSSDRLSMLWACLSAVKGFFEERYEQSIFLPPRYTCLSASDWLYVVITGLKLHTIEVFGWDIGMVSSQLPMDELVDLHLQDIDRYLVVRRQGRVGGQLVPYPILVNLGRVQPPRPVFDVYEQIRHIIGHMKVLGEQEIEMLVQRSQARQQRQRELQQTQMTPGQQQQQLDLERQQEMERRRQQQQHQQQQQQQQGGMGMSNMGYVGGLGVQGAAPVMDSSQMLREFDGTFWQDAFDDPTWMLGGDPASMDWNNY